MSSIIGPFPTTYKPKSACDAISSREVVGIDFPGTCLPSKFNTDSTVFYSPGTACPTGYTAIDRCTQSEDGEDKFTVTCCPQRNGIDMWCVEDPMTLQGPWENMFCTWSAGTKQTVLLVTSEISGTPVTAGVTMSGGDGINAYGIRMIYEKSDLVTATSTTEASTEATADATSAATSSIATATTTNESASAQTSETSSDSSSKGTSGGVIAAAVVVPLVAIAALVGAWFWWRRRKQRHTAIPQLDDTSPKELPSNATSSHGDNKSSQYGYYAPPQELPAMATVSELPGDGPLQPAPSVSSPGVSTTGHNPDVVSPSESDVGGNRRSEVSPIGENGVSRS